MKKFLLSAAISAVAAMPAVSVAQTMPKLSEDGVFLAEKGGEWTVKTSKTNFSDGILAGDIVGRLEIYCKNNLIFDANLYSIVNRRNNF